MTRSLLSIEEEIQKLPPHYHETFSKDFIFLLAGLKRHGFSIQRADEALTTVGSSQDLWPELSHPSVWVYAPAAPTEALKKAEPGSLTYTQHSNEVIRTNLLEQERLFLLLNKFYSHHTSPSPQARFIIETIDLGESCLRPQGSSIRIIKDDATQKQWLKEYQAEVLAFAEFLAA